MTKKATDLRDREEQKILEKLSQMEAYLLEPRIAARIDTSVIQRITDDIARIRDGGSTSIPAANLRGLLGFLEQIAANFPPEVAVPPLLEAIAAGDIKRVKQLIKSGDDVNSALPNGTTALMIAAEKGHNGVVLELIKAGANVNHRRSDSFTAFLIACFNGNEGVVKTLVSNGADVNGLYDIPAAEGAVGNNTGLTIAAHQGKLSVCKLLINLGANINAVTDVGYTPLMSALVNGGDTGVAMFLLNSGANPDPDAVCRVPFSISTTPLALAATNGADDVVRELIRRKVRLDRTDGAGCTAIKRAATEGHAGAVELLLKAGASVDVPDHEGWTPLMNAVATRNFEVAKLLVEVSANVNAAAPDGECVLGLAVATRIRAGEIGKLQGLLGDRSTEISGDPLADYDGLADLSLKLVDFLLSKGANPNVRYKRKSLVVTAGADDALVKLLLKHGAAAPAKKTRKQAAPKDQ